MRRRRKTRYLWLPNTGTIGPGTGGAADTHHGVDFGNFASAGDGTTTMLIRPLILDETVEEQVDRNITNTAKTDYFLKRLVGKWWISRNQTVANNGPATYVGAGVFIAKANDPDSTLSIQQPLGVLQASGVGQTFTGSVAESNAVLKYSPLSADNVTEPWIWRRTWILANAVTTTASPDVAWPRSTAEYGSVADGPHMDARTARRIRDGERLFAVVALRNWPINTSITITSNQCRCFLEYRALGQMRKHRQISAFG